MDELRQTGKTLEEGTVVCVLVMVMDDGVMEIYKQNKHL
jgi:hypothetical protein